MMESFTSGIQALIKTNKDFPEQFKQRLIDESINVNNPFKFIVGLFNERVLCDGSSDTEASVGLTEMRVQLAMMKVCLKGADAIGGLTKALEKSGNLQLISALQTWVNKDFAIETGVDASKRRKAVEAAHTKKSKRQRKKPTKSSTESSSNGANLKGKSMFHVDVEVKRLLDGNLVGKAPAPAGPAEKKPQLSTSALAKHQNDDLFYKRYFICEKCGKQIKHGDRNRHMKRTCPITCELCGRKLSLDFYNRQKLVCKSEYPCEIKHYRGKSCPGIFKTRAEYNLHIYGNNVICDICGGHYRGRDMKKHVIPCKAITI